MDEKKKSFSHAYSYRDFLGVLKGREEDLLYGKQLQMCEGPNILRSGRYMQLHVCV